MLTSALSLIVLGIQTAPMAEEGALDPNLKMFEPILGKTYRGTFTDQPGLVDISRAEKILNGKAVRSLHSINRGMYGGETIFRYDAAKKVVTFHYFTTAEFMTTGTVKAVEGGFESEEEVTGSANGITKVKGRMTLKADGTMIVVAEYFQNGKWLPGRNTTYVEDPTEKVVFKG
jgi:hypothetical protein